MMKNNIVLKRELKKYWKYGALVLFVSLLVELITLVPPKIMQILVDDYIPSENIKGAYNLIFLIVVIPIITTVLRSYITYKVYVTTKKSATNIKKISFLNIINQKMNFFSNKSSGEIASYANKDVSNFIHFWLSDLPDLICGILTTTVVIGLLIQLNFKMALVVMISIPFAILPTTTFGKTVAGYGKKIAENTARANSVITESLKNIRYIKTSNLQDKRTKEFDDYNQEIMPIYGKGVMMEALTFIWSKTFIGAVVTAIVFGIGITEIINGNLSIGSLIAFLTYIPRVFVMCQTISFANVSIKKQIGEFEKSFEYLELDNEYTYEVSKPVSSLESSIEFKNVSFSYSSETIFKNLSFKVKKGDFVTIVGKSGLGKTTIFNLLLRLYDIDSGDILIGNQSIYNLPIKQTRSKISLVSQDMPILNGSIRYNFQLHDINLTDDEIWSVLKDTELYEHIESLPQKLDTMIDEAGDNLSGGQKQRMSLALALVRKPDILLLDEASSNLDMETEKRIHQMVRKLSNEMNLTVISITHRKSFIDNNAKVVKLEDLLA